MHQNPFFPYICAYNVVQNTIYAMFKKSLEFRKARFCLLFHIQHNSLKTIQNNCNFEACFEASTFVYYGYYWWEILIVFSMNKDIYFIEGTRQRMIMS
ncbi:MAG: hypothetical protein C0410_07165 [Anaerolinea sp.]|nr:hypothetical protein [Anaerolinea sp.]